MNQPKLDTISCINNWQLSQHKKTNAKMLSIVIDSAIKNDIVIGWIDFGMNLLRNVNFCLNFLRLRLFRAQLLCLMKFRIFSSLLFIFMRIFFIMISTTHTQLVQSDGTNVHCQNPPLNSNQLHTVQFHTQHQTVSKALPLNRIAEVVAWPISNRTSERFLCQMPSKIINDYCYFCCRQSMISNFIAMTIVFSNFV